MLLDGVSWFHMAIYFVSNHDWESQTVALWFGRYVRV